MHPFSSTRTVRGCEAPENLFNTTLVRNNSVTMSSTVPVLAKPVASEPVPEAKSGFAQPATEVGWKLRPGLTCLEYFKQDVSGFQAPKLQRPGIFRWSHPSFFSPMLMNFPISKVDTTHNDPTAVARTPPPCPCWRLAHLHCGPKLLESRSDSKRDMVRHTTPWKRKNHLVNKRGPEKSTIFWLLSD